MAPLCHAVPKPLTRRVALFDGRQGTAGDREPPWFVLCHSNMTVTVSPRRVAMAVLAVIALSATYLIGATRAVGTAVTASTRAATTRSTQPVAYPASGSPGINVGGRAKVAGTPDTLRLDLSVVASATSVSEALASANRSASAVQKSLLDNDVQKKDLQTSGLNIAPEYAYSNNSSPRLKGYQVTESISARLRDLGRAGDAIGKAVSAGGNAVRVNGISLDLEDIGALVSSARDKAFADAKAKAEQYARAAGRSLGDVMSISEDVTTPSPIPVPYGLNGSAKDMASVPIEPGSQDVSVSVTVLFEMR